MVVSFTGGGNRRKTTEMSEVADKTLSHNVGSITPCYKRDLNSQP